jgi:hypothetical protein
MPRSALPCHNSDSCQACLQDSLHPCRNRRARRRRRRGPVGRHGPRACPLSGTRQHARTQGHAAAVHSRVDGRCTGSSGVGFRRSPGRTDRRREHGQRRYAAPLRLADRGHGARSWLPCRHRQRAPLPGRSRRLRGPVQRTRLAKTSPATRFSSRTFGRRSRRSPALSRPRSAPTALRGSTRRYTSPVGKLSFCQLASPWLTSRSLPAVRCKAGGVARGSCKEHELDLSDHNHVIHGSAVRHVINPT